MSTAQKLVKLIESAAEADRKGSDARNMAQRIQSWANEPGFCPESVEFYTELARQQERIKQSAISDAELLLAAWKSK